MTPERLAELREYVYERIDGYSQSDFAELFDAVAALQAELAEANHAADVAEAQTARVMRELERWRHGVTIEGDFVCPNELRAVNAERERDDLRAKLSACVAALEATQWGSCDGCSSHAYCPACKQPRHQWDDDTPDEKPIERHAADCVVGKALAAAKGLSG